MEEGEQSAVSLANDSLPAVQRRSLPGVGTRITGQPGTSTTRPRRRSSRRLSPTQIQQQTSLDHHQVEEIVSPSGDGEIDPPRERKISRIFTMLQTVQSSVNLLTSATPQVKPPAAVVPSVLSRSDTNTSLFLPLRNPLKDRLKRLDSCSSWTGSECSQSSTSSESTTCSVPPPLIHSVPHHKDGPTSLFIVASSTYAQLLIVICVVVALSEVVTHNMPSNYFEGFFAYLYSGSIAFFLYFFCYLLRSQHKQEMKKKQRQLDKHKEKKKLDSGTISIGIDESESPRRFRSFIHRSASSFGLNWAEDPPASSHDQTSASYKKMKVSENDHSHGSLFLRAGAVGFGIGTMIYDGLEFGAFLEIPSDSPCHFILRGINPVLHAVFVFLQMYFIFISARLNIQKFKFIARFGLMHCVATNVCVWIRTLVRESLKEIRHHSVEDVHHSASDVHLSTSDVHHDSLWELTSNVSCGGNIFLGGFIMDASPFLYPFLIEYSLIGAAVLHFSWTHVGFNPKYRSERDTDVKLNKSQLRVDCMGVSKGLFLGLFFLATSLLCMVLFFILISQPDSRLFGLILADTAHCSLLSVSLIAIAIGAYRTRHLAFHPEQTEELGGMLLRVSALGIFAHSAFSVTAAALSAHTEEPFILVLINGLLSIIEVTVQLLFISDMSRRRVSSTEQDSDKPGRQSVTFLLIINLALWLVYTFEMQKLEANPVQMNFYGFLPWIIVQRMTLPLCIFYRFHSAIIYAEIWKNAYRFTGLPS